MSNNRRRGPRPATNGTAVAVPVVKSSAPLQFTTPTDSKFGEREPLFTIDGVEHTVLKQVPVGATLAYIEMGGRQDADAAILFALRYALTDAGYSALRGYEALTEDQFAAVVELVRAKFDRPLDPKAR